MTASGEVQRYFLNVVLNYDGKECLIWPYSTDRYGYAQIRYEGLLQYVSRLVCKKANGPPPTPKHEAAHSCGKGHKACVAQMHLDWKTHADNLADMIAHGTHRRGSRNPIAKLEEHQVREIRSLRGSVSQRELARRFGVHQGTIADIHTGDIWAWLGDAPE